MAFDTFVNFGDIKGESLDHTHKDWIETASATVQLGETSIGQVANRLGVDKDHLMLANPQIKNPSQLNVGQEIFLPKPPIPKSEGSSAGEASAIQGSVLPKPPIDDPLTASFLKESLSKDTKLDREMTDIGRQREEAQQKYANAMDAAATEAALGVAGGVAANLGGANTTAADNQGASSKLKREDAVIRKK